jgi:methylenetetrahydrofolate reductase (NADH)
VDRMLFPQQEDERARLLNLLKVSSIEVTARSDDQMPVLKEVYRRGIDVHVTALPTDKLEQTLSTARHLAEAGFVPVPHLTARRFDSRKDLEEFIAGAADAGVRRMLVIAGDTNSQGPFADSVSVLKTGLLQKHGIRSISVAGHPESHPKVDKAAMEDALRAKYDYARDNGLEIDIITQFVFEAQPVLEFLKRLRALRIDAPVHVGIAGPANLTTLITYGMRCGVGNSIRALKNQSNLLGKLVQTATPDDLLKDVVRTTGSLGERIAGFHFYIFGGLRKTGTWLNGVLESLATEVPVR